MAVPSQICMALSNSAQCYVHIPYTQWRTQQFCSGEGFQQSQLRTEDRENGDLGAVAP